ncbi:MAG: hypothetical protein ABID38_03210 [Candidatus Diapherotrites archaeon]
MVIKVPIYPTTPKKKKKMKRARIAGKVRMELIIKKGIERKSNSLGRDE